MNRAHAYATQRWKIGTSDGIREEMMAAIKSSVDHHYGSCAQCEKNARD